MMTDKKLRTLLIIMLCCLAVSAVSLIIMCISVIRDVLADVNTNTNPLILFCNTYLLMTIVFLNLTERQKKAGYYKLMSINRLKKSKQDLNSQTQAYDEFLGENVRVVTLTARYPFTCYSGKLEQIKDGWLKLISTGKKGERVTIVQLSMLSSIHVLKGN